MKTLLTVAYDGTNYSGWQRQKNGKSVAGEVDSALSRLFKTDVNVLGASRTDAGVHALGQRASFSLEHKIPEEKLPYAVNTFLPEDIRITAAKFVHDEFHPIFDVIKKTYQYRIFCGAFVNPLLRRFSAFVNHSLDIEKMRDVASFIKGRHDFSAFMASGSSAKTTVREIYDLDINYGNDIITITVSGNGFLYNMVRIIVGTLVAVGENKIDFDFIEKIILSKDRTLAGKTFPAQGLCLNSVNYSELS